MKVLLRCVLLGSLVYTVMLRRDSTFSPSKVDEVKWCVTSAQEKQKCERLRAVVSAFTCVQKNDTAACINAIKAGEADAITVDGGDVYKAGLPPNGLKPIIAEDYGEDSDTCYYAVAVAKNGSGFGFTEMKGLNSCHTGLGKSAGWNIPIAILVTLRQIQWDASKNKTIETAVSELFSASCVPGAVQYPHLCQQCIGNCSYSHSEGYYDYGGAFRCLKENAGQVAFVKHSTVPASEKLGYELLCKNGSRQSIDAYKSCHLTRVPAHAVVSRNDSRITKLIWTALHEAEKHFPLFSSSQYNEKDLMFTDDTVKLVQTPARSDAFTYLGAEYLSIIRTLDGEAITGGPLRWCAVGTAEAQKCNLWMNNSMNGTDKDGITCITGDNTEDCIGKILRNKADAITLDGGDVFTAGKCGLVPAMVEQYDTGGCASENPESSSYYVVAVVRKGSGLTWRTLKGRKSCHTGMGHTAGWNIPMGLLHKQSGHCDITRFFKKSCVPGAKPGSSLCALCMGGPGHTCKASADEPYFGYVGAFRCLAEGAGDVAFIRHTTVQENTDGNGTNWTATLKSTEFELLCPNGSIPTAPVSDYLTCHLAKVPAHAVMTRPESRTHVIDVLKQQQAMFGQSGVGTFSMFSSTGGNDLLFKDSTHCLVEVPANQTVWEFLGADYIDAVTSLRQCEERNSDLEQACSFHQCQNS